MLGSAITQTFTVQAGQRISFEWDFLTNQTYNDGTADSVAPSAANDDFSFASIVFGGSSQVMKLADVFDGFQTDSGNGGGFDTAFTITPPSDPFISETGFHTFSFYCEFDRRVYARHRRGGVWLAGNEDGVNSGLLVDHVQVTPEPASMVCLLGMSIRLTRRLARRNGKRC